MSKVVWTGIESSGKSLRMSVQAEKVLQRNIKWLAITGVPRTMAFNMPMSLSFIERVKSAGLVYVEWKNFIDIENLQEADIFIDELIKLFPASGSSSLNQEQLNFITQGAKSGIHIYATSQDFSQVHKQFRLLVNQVFVVTKLFGSERPMKTAPPVKRIWGVCFIREVEPNSFKGDSVTMETVGWPSFFLIQKEDCERYFTGFKVPNSSLPIKKVKRQIHYCEEDGYRKVTYV